MFKRKYRIVTDRYLGYEVQYKVWWFPFWIQARAPGLRINTWENVEEAEKFIEKLKARDKVYG